MIFSYENCLIAEAEGRVIGMMHSFVMRHDPEAQPETDPVLAPYADIKSPDTLYISSLALHEGWRSLRLGQQFATGPRALPRPGCRGPEPDRLCRQHRARRFYERHGFEIVKTCQITPHPLIRVTGERRI